MYISQIMWHKNSYRFSPFYKCVKKIIDNKSKSKPPKTPLQRPPQTPTPCLDHKDIKSLKSIARLQFGPKKK
tara:strand:+ start:322 stop:537 length:216 start_codon:yes stop_codon:yes gene_type:complete